MTRDAWLSEALDAWDEANDFDDSEGDVIYSDLTKDLYDDLDAALEVARDCCGTEATSAEVHAELVRMSLREATPVHARRFCVDDVVDHIECDLPDDEDASDRLCESVRSNAAIARAVEIIDRELKDLGPLYWYPTSKPVDLAPVEAAVSRALPPAPVPKEKR